MPKTEARTFFGPSGHRPIESLTSNAQLAERDPSEATKHSVLYTLYTYIYDTYDRYIST